MKASIIDKNWNIVKQITVSWPIKYINTDFCVVCEDISDYVWFFIKISNDNWDVYTWEIINYIDELWKRKVLMKHWIYVLDTLEIWDWFNYTDTDISVILKDIINDYKSKTSHWIIDVNQNIWNTWIKITIDLNWFTYLDAVQYIIENIANWYWLNYTIWWTILLDITDNSVNINNESISKIWYSWVWWEIINKVTVTNWKDISETVENTDSINLYWERYKKIYETVYTSQDAINIWNSIIDKQSEVKKTITYIETKDLSINKINNKVNILWEEYYIIDMIYNEKFTHYILSQKPYEFNLKDIESLKSYINKQDNVVLQEAKDYTDEKFDNIWMWIAWWTNTISLSATSNDSIEWTSWEINLQDWTTYNINSWSISWMTAVTYIYIDSDISTSELQYTTTAQDAVWKNKLLIAVAKNNSEDNKLATFQTFWTDSQSTFITADNIAANTITGNEIVGNSIKASEIDAATLNLWDFSGNLDDIWDWTDYRRIKWTALTSDWLVSMDAIVDWDYAKVKSTSLTSDWLVVLDKVVDWDYSKVKSTSVSAGKIILSETQWDLDDIDDGSTYKKTTSSEKTWAWRAYNALNSSNRYKEWLVNSELSSWDDPDYWVILDSDWLRWYKSWSKTFEIDTNWNAFFKWEIWASSFTTDWYVEAENSDWDRIWFWIDSWYPKIKFYDDWDYIWYIKWRSTTVNWESVNVINSTAWFTSSEFIVCETYNDDIPAILWYSHNNHWWWFETDEDWKYWLYAKHSWWTAIYAYWDVKINWDITVYDDLRVYDNLQVDDNIVSYWTIWASWDIITYWKFSAPNLPTSSDWLSSWDLWNDNWVVKIV